MTMHDYIWLYMFDCVWVCMTMYEYVWLSMRERKRARAIYKLFPTFANIFKLLKFFTWFKFSQTFNTFQQTLTQFTFVYICSHLFTFVYLCLPLCTFVYLCSTDASMHKLCACLYPFLNLEQPTKLHIEVIFGRWHYFAVKCNRLFHWIDHKIKLESFIPPGCFVPDLFLLVVVKPFSESGVSKEGYVCWVSWISMLRCFINVSY